MQSIDNLVQRLLAPLQGYKTKIGAVMLAVLAVNQATPFLGPTAAGVIQYVAYALVGYGLRDAIDRQSA